MCVDVREALVGVGFLLPPRESQGSNLGCQAWQLAPLPAESTCRPHFLSRFSLNVSDWFATHCIAPADLKEILLPSLPKCYMTV